MVRSIQIALTAAMSIVLAALLPQTATATQSNVFVTGVLCQSSLSLYQRSSDKKPIVYVDNDVAVEHPYPVNAFSADNSSIQLAFNVQPGFHRILVAAKYGGQSTMLDVLPGHSRHVVLQVCRNLLHADTLRSVAVVLPSEGLTPYLLVHTPRGDETVQMSIEDGVAYGDLLDEGAIELTVPYWAHVVSCSFSLAQGTPKWRQQHLRFSLTIAGLVSRSTEPIPGACGSIQPL
jgi:hypothetical protein